MLSLPELESSVQPFQLLDSWPDITDQKIIGFDIETEDLGLAADMGPGALRGQGKILGYGIHTEKFEHYFPVAHEDGVNYDNQKVLTYLNDMLKTDIPKVGANIQYDMEWSYSAGLHIAGPIRDIQIAEPMLDEEKPGGYSLNNLAKFYLGEEKEEELLFLAMERYGIKTGKRKADKKPQKYLKHFAPEYVGPYCIADARQAVQIYKKQIPLLRSEDLWPIFDMESKLIPIFMKMKIHGVRVDTSRCEQLVSQLNDREDKLKAEMKRLSGLEIEPWSADTIMKYFDQEGMKYRMTKPTKANPEGNPSFTGEFLAKQEDKVCDMIAEWRKVNTMKVRYVEDVLKYAHNGRIHSCIHQLASDDDEYGGAYGTRSGRLSYSHLNLQKIPKRDKEWRTIIRSLFLPDEGCFWGQQDYSQQEPRLGVHYASLRNMPGAGEAVEAYHQPGADFHTIVANMAGIDRDKSAKPLNLGSWYGMGLAKMLVRLGGDTPENRSVYYKYHETFPFVKDLLKDCMRYADRRGWVKTILGRRAHFRDVVPRLDWDTKQKEWDRYKPTRIENVPKRIEELNDQLEKETDADIRAKLQQDIKRWESGRFERVGTYKALNRIIQGSAADQTKKSILDIYEHFGHVQFTQIQVHDELDGSYQSIDDLKKVRDLMQDAITLKVPVIVEPETGPSWGEVTKWKEN